MNEEQEKATTVDGVRAVEMRYRAIFSTDTKEPAFYQSSIRLNSPDMGVLLPERFMPVLESDDRCISVFKLALLQTLKAAEKFTSRELDFDWISVFMPLRLLRKRSCFNTVKEFTEMLGAYPQKICFEIPAMLIDEDNDNYRESIRKLRRAGYHAMIAGVGGESFPLMKLAELEPDYVLLSEDITNMIGVNKRSDICVNSIISFINELDAKPVASGVTSAEKADLLYDIDCPFYTGSEDFGGNYIGERFLRRKTQE